MLQLIPTLPRLEKFSKGTARSGSYRGGAGKELARCQPGLPRTVNTVNLATKLETKGKETTLETQRQQSQVHGVMAVSF